MYKPKTAWITVNRACQFRCQWCYGTSTGFNQGSDMDYETAKSIILLLKEVGVNNVVLIGGEPTLWKHLFRFNDLCNRLSIKTNLVTNAYEFRHEHFWTEYLKHPNTRIEPSLKAFDEYSHMCTTKNNDFNGLKIGVRRITSENKTMVGVVYSTLIEGKLLEMVSAAVDLGAFSVRVGVCTPMSKNGKFEAPFTMAYDKMVMGISTNYKKMVDVTKGKISFALNTPLCIWPRDFVQDAIAHNRLGAGGCQFRNRTGIVFDTDGKVIPCNSMFECSVGKYGVDFSDSKSFLALLNSDEVDEIYKHINSYPSKKCMDCDLFPRCRGGCPIMWTVYNTDEVVHAVKE